MRHKFRRLPVGRTKRRDDSENKLDHEFSKRMILVHRKHGDCHEEDPDSGVVYVANIPHGFYEVQMYRYFTQFGRIKRLRLSRSKKSGRSKGFAFIEFEFAEVAKAVADTMNNYLFMRKMLKCEFVPKEKLHSETFRGCFSPLPKPTGRKESIKRNNAYLQADPVKVAKNLRRRAKQETKKEKLLAEMGIDFKIDAYNTEFLAVQDRLEEGNKVFDLQNWEEGESMEPEDASDEGPSAVDGDGNEGVEPPVSARRKRKSSTDTPVTAKGKPSTDMPITAKEKPSKDTPVTAKGKRGKKHPIKEEASPKTEDKKTKKTGRLPKKHESPVTPKTGLIKSKTAKSTGKKSLAGRKQRSAKSRQSM